MEVREACPCCGLVAARVDGPVDPYGVSSSGCWAAFLELHHDGLSQLAVDSYMAQHAQRSTAAGRRSVLTHLVGLWLALRCGATPDRIRQVYVQVFPDKGEAPPDLGPPPDLTGFHVGHVLAARPDVRAATVAWAEHVFGAWSERHALVFRLGEVARARCDPPDPSSRGYRRGETVGRKRAIKAR